MRQCAQRPKRVFYNKYIFIIQSCPLTDSDDYFQFSSYFRNETNEKNVCFAYFGWYISHFIVSHRLSHHLRSQISHSFNSHAILCGAMVSLFLLLVFLTFVCRVFYLLYKKARINVIRWEKKRWIINLIYLL